VDIRVVWIALGFASVLPHPLGWCHRLASILWPPSVALWSLELLPPLLPLFWPRFLGLSAALWAFESALDSAWISAPLTPWLVPRYWPPFLGRFWSASDCSWISASARLGRGSQFGLGSLAALCGAVGFRVSFGSRLDLDQRSLKPWFGVTVWPRFFGHSPWRFGLSSWLLIALGVG
jgi:hypothetical protein